jgi:hypothetical protein
MGIRRRTITMNGLLSNAVKLIKVADHAGAATSGVTSEVVDTSGYDGVLFLTSFGTAAANNTLKAQQGAVSAMSDAADLAGSLVASGTSDEDVWIDVYRPRERYVRVVAARGTSSTLESIWAILYRGSLQPVVNVETGTITGKALVSPAEGTA